MTNYTAILLLMIGALVAASTPAQRGRVADDERTAETAARAVGAFFRAARDGKTKTAARCGERVVAHGALAVDPLVESLEKRSRNEIVYALRAIGYLLDGRTEAVVLKLCRHQDAEVRATAIVTGCRAHPASMTQVLRTAIADKNQIVRRRAYDGVLALPVAERAAFIGPACQGVLDSDFWVRSRSLRILAGAGPAPAVGADTLLADSLRVMPELTKESADPLFRVLGKVRRDAMSEIIEVALRKGSIHAQVAAFGAAANLRQSDHVGRALRLMKSRDDDLAKAATAYIGGVRDRKSVRALVDLLATTRNEGRREVIAIALRQITGRALGYDIDAWRAWMDQDG